MQSIQLKNKTKNEKNFSQITLCNFPTVLQKKAFILSVVHVSSESKRLRLVLKQVTLVI